MWHFETFMSFCLRLYRDVWVAPSTSTPRGRTLRMDSAFQRIPIGLVSHVIYFVWYHVMLYFHWYITKIFSWKFFNIACKKGLGKTTIDRRHESWQWFYWRVKTLRVVFFSFQFIRNWNTLKTVSYTHLRAHETSLHLVCRLLLEKNTLVS